VATTTEANLGACQRAAAAAPDAAGYRFCQAAAGCGDGAAAKGACDLVAARDGGGAPTVEPGAGWVSAVRRAAAV